MALRAAAQPAAALLAAAARRPLCPLAASLGWRCALPAYRCTGTACNAGNHMCYQLHQILHTSCPLTSCRTFVDTLHTPRSSGNAVAQ